MTNLEFYKEELLNENEHSYLAISNAMMNIYQKYTGQSKVYADNLIDWLYEEHKEPTLTEKEKEYLSAVIRPFRKKITFIVKYPYTDSRCYLTIYYLEDSNETYMSFPAFEEGTMYKGMHADLKYTLEELGL